jgi:PAS domain S-box-containing protein
MPRSSAKNKTGLRGVSPNVPRQSTGPDAKDPGLSGLSLDFRILFESWPGAYLVLDPDLVIIAVSDAHLAASMTSRSDVIGKEVSEAFPDNPDDPESDGAARLRASLDRVRQHKVADTMPVQQYDIRRPVSGEFETRFWSVMNSPVLDHNRNLLYIINRAEDITEYIRLKERQGRQQPLDEELQIHVDQMEAEILARALDLQETNHELQRLAAIVEYADDAILTNVAGVITSWNAGAVKLYGYTEQEALGQPMSMLVPAGYDDEVPAMLEETVAARKAVLGDTVRVRKNGTLVDVSFALSPIFNAAGEVIEVASISRDITERKRTEHSLVERSRQLETSNNSLVVRSRQLETSNDSLVERSRQLETSNDSLVERSRQLETSNNSLVERSRQLETSNNSLVERSRQLETSNNSLVERSRQLETSNNSLVERSRQLETSNESLVERSQQLETSNESLVERSRQLETSNNSLVERSRQLETSNNSLVERSRQLETSNNSLVERSQQLETSNESLVERSRQLETSNNSLAERSRQLETSNNSLAERSQQLEASNEELGQYAYVASHDLQEPLRKMASFCQLLARRYKGELDEQADEFIAYIVDGARRMQEMINDLLKFSQAGRSPEVAVAVDCNEVVERARIDLAGAIDDNGASIVVTGTLPTVRGEWARLVQLFENLIGNGIKFHGKEPPRIEISAVPDGTGWRFAVADNGIGIDPQYADRIFALFQRLHSKADYPGTGIGLAVCKKIVEGYGGTLAFESQPGEGTTFYWTMPEEEVSP